MKLTQTIIWTVHIESMSDDYGLEKKILKSSKFSAYVEANPSST